MSKVRRLLPKNKIAELEVQLKKIQYLSGYMNAMLMPLRVKLDYAQRLRASVDQDRQGRFYVKLDINR